MQLSKNPEEETDQKKVNIGEKEKGEGKTTPQGSGKQKECKKNKDPTKNQIPIQIPLRNNSIKIGKKGGNPRKEMVSKDPEKGRCIARDNNHRGYPCLSILFPFSKGKDPEMGRLPEK